MAEDEVAYPDEAERVGDRLRAARERAGLDLGDIANRTRIPMRQLDAIERSDYAALPSSTYALGFVRAYARTLGEDDASYARDLRVELGREEPPVRETFAQDVADPARVPSRLLAWTAAILALLVIGGYALWRSGAFDRDAVPAVADRAPTATAPAAAPSPVATPASGGEVALTASAPVWVRISDGATALVEKEMAAGERFVVPATAADPRIVTGRPEALTVTINGATVAPLGAPAATVRNLSLKAEALRARPAAAPETR